MEIIREKSELAGKEVVIKSGEYKDQKYKVEDLWINVSGGKSWINCNGNFACLNYAIRSSREGLPTDDRVLYGKIDGLGYLVHVSEIDKAH